MASVFHFYSLGIVVENKPRSDNHVNVAPIETNPAYDGEVTLNPMQEISEGIDAYGKAYSVKTTSDVSLPCIWLPCGANRVTAPDVRRGMQVEIWRLGDTDDYYWRFMGLDSHLMTLETVIYAWSATPNAGGGAIDVSNCYFFEISTHEGLVTFQNSKANGEPFQYTMQLNTKRGELTITDDIGNALEFDSKENMIKASNPDGSSVELSKKVVSLIGPEKVRFQSGGTTFEMSPSGAALVTPAFDIKQG